MGAVLGPDPMIAQSPLKMKGLGVNSPLVSSTDGQFYAVNGTGSGAVRVMAYQATTMNSLWSTPYPSNGAPALLATTEWSGGRLIAHFSNAAGAPAFYVISGATGALITTVPVPEPMSAMYTTPDFTNVLATGATTGRLYSFHEPGGVSVISANARCSLSTASNTGVYVVCACAPRGGCAAASLLNALDRDTLVQI